MRAGGDSGGELTSERIESGEGPAPEWPNDLEPGTWISGRYVIVRCIGSGGVGAVYEAEQHSLGRQVAIKLLHPEQLRSAKGKERFEREARTAASINHRHVVAIHDFDTHQGVPYLVMELLRGQSMQQLLATAGPLPLGRGLVLLLGASRGLEALHASGLVHRDLKPANLFVSQGDGAEYCKILDFGITKQREGQNLTASSELVGTPAYMAPERIERPAEADHRVDIYALAATGYEMFAGHNLHTGTPQEVLLRVLAGALPPLSAFTAVMPESLARLLYRCLSKRPEDRPETAAELSAELERILGELSASSEEKLHGEFSQPTLRSRKGGKRRRAVPLALASGAFLVSLVTLFIVVQGERREAKLEAARANEPPPGAAAARGQLTTESAEPEPVTAPPAVRVLSSRPEAPELAARRERAPRAVAAGAARSGRRKNDVERSSALLPRKSNVRGSSDPPAKQPTPSASADSSLPVASSGDSPRFMARTDPPRFVSRASDEPGAPRPTSASGRQPLAPGYLFRPRPSKED
jgi:eukaryotic-like serine/threonine-protein kinase